MEKDFRNFIGYPIITPKKVKTHNCCGFAASGDAPVTPVSATVTNISAWSYAKTALALVGAFIIGKYLYTKFVK
jgi:uncharacterized membrane protein